MAKINELSKKIEGFDTMSAEEKLNALLGMDYSNDSEDKLKQLISKANAEASKYKEELRAKQTEEERKEAERKEHDAKIQEELEMLRREKTVSEYTTRFVSVGYDEAMAKSSAEAMASGDTNKVFENFKTFVTNREQSIKADLLKKETPKPDGSNPGGSTITKEKFNAMGYSERVKLFEENPELYKELNK